jgi:hypothetical protein
MAMPYPAEITGGQNFGERQVNTGGRLIKHARYYWLLLAESQLTLGVCCEGLRRFRHQQDRRAVDRNRFRC